MAFGLVFARAFDVLDRMDKVAVRNHRMKGRFFKFSARVVLGGAALVLRRMLQKFGGFQVMIDALLRHVFRITNGIVNLESWRFQRPGQLLTLDSRSRVRLQPGATVVLSKRDCDSGSCIVLSRTRGRGAKRPLGPEPSAAE